MFKMLKRTLTFVLAFAVIAAGIPFFGIELPKLFADNISANAADDEHTTDNYKYTVSGSSATITGYSGAILGNLSIPSTLDKYNVTAIGEKAFDSELTLLIVTIPDTVKTIGKRAFYNCTFLTKVVIGSAVTKIDDLAFGKCTNLPSITIPKNVSTIGSGAFAFCSALETILVDSSNTSYDVTGGVLYNSKKTLILAYPAKKSGDSFTVPSAVNSIDDYAFSGSKLSTVTLGSKVAILGSYVFANSAIKTIDMSDCALSAIGVYAFKDCTNLSTITLPGTVSSVGSGTFAGCTSLSKAVLSSKMDSVTDSMFDGCKELTDLSIPATLKAIGKAAFKNCSSMKGVVIPESVSSIGDAAFSGCKSLVKFTVDKDNYFTTVDNGVLTNKAKTKLICYPADRSGATYTVPSSITTLGSYSFDSCANLGTLTIPNTVTKIEDNAVNNCSGLTIACEENSAADKYFSANKGGYSSLQTSGNSPALVVSNASGKVGSTVNVTVSIKNNPGLVATSFTVKYDASKVSLKKIANTDLLEGFTYQNSPLLSTCKVTFADSDAKKDVTKDGVLVTFSFEILSIFTSGSTTVSVTVDSNDTYNSALKEVSLRATNGTITIGSGSSDGKSGDVNGDGTINGKDATLLRRHVAGWTNITIEKGNSDVNGDGSVNSKDATILRRYIAGWNVTLK